MKSLSKALFLLVAVVNLIPVSGFLSADHLSRLYGLTFDDPNLEILMRHRAVLFGIVGVLLVLAAFKPQLQQLAVAFGLISMLSFVLVALLVGDYNPHLARVVLVDVGASVALVGAAAASWRAANVNANAPSGDLTPGADKGG